MKKYITLLMLCVSMLASAQDTYITSTLHSYMKAIPDNNPEKFWEGLHKLHRQVKAMQKAKENNKASMREALEGMGNIYRIRTRAEKDGIKNDTVARWLDSLSLKLGIVGADYYAKFYLVPANEINAVSYPDGTFLIYTGLLSNIENEEELIGILAHETAHLTLWHVLNDKWRTIKAVKQNQMWAEIGTGLAFGAYSYAQMSYASNGAAIPQDEYQRVSQQIADAGVAIREDVTARTKVFTKLRYMRDTEEEADEAAFWFMEKNGYDPINYINFWKRYYDSLPAYKKQASKKKEKYSTHPDIPKRIKKLEWLYKKYHGK